jgi:hypothetical protein
MDGGIMLTHLVLVEVANHILKRIVIGVAAYVFVLLGVVVYF